VEIFNILRVITGRAFYAFPVSGEQQFIGSGRSSINCVSLNSRDEGKVIVYNKTLDG